MNLISTLKSFTLAFSLVLIGSFLSAGSTKYFYNGTKLYNLCRAENTIDEALKKIPEDEYSSAFNEMAKKEWIKRTNLNLSTRRRRFSNTLHSRGWEYYLIKDFIAKQIKNKNLID